MTTAFAALIYRDAEVSETALTLGFGIALGGWDVRAPELLVARLGGLPGWSVAFYESGDRALGGDDAFEHACELFEEELSPAQCVLDAALELSGGEAVVYALTYTEAFVHDDAWRFDRNGVERRFVREGEEGLEAGFELPDAGEVRPLDVPFAESATEDEEQAALDRVLRPHRGTAFVARELDAPVLATLVGALFATEKRIVVRWAEPTAEGITEQVRSLNRTLGRTDARGSFVVPIAIGGVPTSPAFAAFVAAYDWTDPADPKDLYRELAIGRIEGALRFLREPELAAFAATPNFAAAAKEGFHPLATFETSGVERLVGLGTEGERLVVIGRQGRLEPAGPTFGELVRYLALGWKRRTPLEEELIGALMLKAHLRADGGG